MRLTLKDKATITKVYHFINANFWTHFPIRYFVSAYKIDESTLTRGFKHLYQYTIYKYRLVISMEYAHAYIQAGAQIKNLQKELGYKTTGSFARAYKKIFGQQPNSATSGQLRTKT